MTKNVGDRLPATEKQLAILLEWLEEFKLRNGRPLRVLHVGNIAANGYLNTKFLRRVGVEADIVSRDYYHVMSYPEWEDLDISQSHGDDFNPVFSKQDLKNYSRPDWFFNGPLVVCAEKIANRYGPIPLGRRFTRKIVAYWRNLAEMTSGLARKLFGQRVGNASALLMLSPKEFYVRFIIFMGKLSGEKYRFTITGQKWSKKNCLLADRVVAEFDQVFPDRKDRLTVDEVLEQVRNVPYFAQMFAPYDIVQCYATEPIFGLLSGKQPYIGFEHGTLRHFTTGDDALNRLTALAYRRAAHTFITNGDCLKFARKIGIENYSPIIHPIDVEQHRQDFGDDTSNLRRKLGGDIILFCPVRHDYAIKGTEFHLNALPLIKDRLKKKIKLVLIRWGEQIEESVTILENNGCIDDVIWETPMSRLKMIKYIRASDVVLDQMVLPPFGSTAPQSLAAGTPVISSYVPECTAWMFPEPAPIMSAFSAKQIADCVLKAVDKNWRTEFENRAQNWIDKYHHPDNVIISLLSTYRKVLANQIDAVGNINSER